MQVEEEIGGSSATAPSAEKMTHTSRRARRRRARRCGAVAGAAMRASAEPSIIAERIADELEKEEARSDEGAPPGSARLNGIEPTQIGQRCD